jgi:hypothetical protein
MKKVSVAFLAITLNNQDVIAKVSLGGSKDDGEETN